MDEFEINSYKSSGKIACEVVGYAKGFIKRGMKLIDIAEKIEFKILDLGGEVAFPTNLSLDEVAAHYTPSVDDETVADGLLKVDLGVSVNGFIADTAFSLDLSIDKRYTEMIELNKKILDEVLDSLNVGSVVCDVGNFIFSKIEGSGFNIIKNLSGHSLDKDNIHAGLTISNYKNDSHVKLEGAVAIEPFLTVGDGSIYEGKDGEIFMLQGDGRPRDRDARLLLGFIKENYKTKPFCRRWLEKQGFSKLGFFLKQFVMQGILHNFAVLVEKSKKVVSQVEHTVLFLDNEVVVTTR